MRTRPNRHARQCSSASCPGCPGHPRLLRCARKTWMAGTSPAMTTGNAWSLRHHLWISVPVPWLVNSSSSTACGVLPSMMTTPCDALLERVDAGFDLRDHAAGNGAVGDQLARILHRQFRNQLLRLVEHAGNVGQQQQPLGLQRAGDRAGKGVGIDVEGLPGLRGRQRRQHRDQLMADQLVQQRQVDLFGFADEAEIDHLFDVANPDRPWCASPSTPSPCCRPCRTGRPPCRRPR